MLPYATVAPGAVPLLLLLATGCSVLTPGDGEFSCPRTAGGVGCLSARQVYLATETTDTVTAPPSAGKGGTEATPTEAGQEPGPSRGGDARMELDRTRPPVRKAAAAEPAVPRPPPASNAVARPLPTPGRNEPLPVRTPAQVMRIWMAPWEDRDGSLYTPGYTFIEIEPRRWQLGRPPPHGEAEPHPLQIEARAATEPPGAPAAGLSGFLKDPRRLSDRKP